MAIIKGTNGADTLTGASGDVVYGYGGNDTLYLFSSTNAKIDGGIGNDLLKTFYASNSIVLGGSDNDKIDLYDSKYIVASGGTGNDTISGYIVANSIIKGDSGNDHFDDISAGKYNLLDGGTGNDRFDLQSDAGYGNTVLGGDGDDTVNFYRPISWGGSYDESTISGGAGNDLIFTDSGRQVINGDSGDDTILVSGFDNAHFSYRIKTVNGGSGNDYINASYKAGQSIYSDNFAINANGGAGNDHLIGSAVADTIYGGSGSDVINGRGGNDILAGNSATAGDYVRDTFVFSSTDGAQTDTILKFEHNIDKVQLASPLAWKTIWADAANTYFQYGFVGQSGVSQITFAGVNNVTYADFL